jgi:hypothetical protein
MMNLNIHNVERIFLHDEYDCNPVREGKNNGTHAELTIFFKNFDGELVKFSIDLFADRRLSVSLIDADTRLTTYDVDKFGSIPYSEVNRAIGEKMARDEAKSSMRGERRESDKGPDDDC